MITLVKFILMVRHGQHADKQNKTHYNKQFSLKCCTGLFVGVSHVNCNYKKHANKKFLNIVTISVRIKYS